MRDHLVDRAWDVLSGAAEALLAEDGGRHDYPARALVPEPTMARQPRSAMHRGQTVRIARRRRTLRMIRELARRPEDSNLRAWAFRRIQTE